ncbi:MAG: Sip1-related alpha-galactosidase [Bacteroidota bacterium]
MLIFLLIGGSCAGKDDASIGSRILDFKKKNFTNVIVLEAPDRGETLHNILLPDFEKYVHVAADSNQFRWIGASNRMFPWVGEKDLKSIFEPKSPIPPRIPNPNRRALTMLFKLTNGNFLTLLPLSGKSSVSWLEVNEKGELTLDYGTLGTDLVPNDLEVPLLAWYESPNIYESVAKTWELALADERVSATANLRAIKKYPEPLKYLGWCTWEQYHKNINEEILSTAMDNIESSGVPVRWFLIDDGHQDDNSGLLLSFDPNKEKFPNGWSPITSRKSDEGIKWMGIWHGFLSHWNGVHVDHTMETISPYLIPNPNRENGLLPGDDQESSNAFYDYLVTTIKDQGFDFMKTDNVSRSTIEYYGSPNPARAQRENVLALEAACLKHDIGLMNCSAQNTIDMLNASSSATMRTSPDYQKYKLETSKSQILQSVFNVIWLGQTLWPDHDMFHSSDEQVGEAMAVTKALSGGPIYLSDDPSEFVPEVITPLGYSDGQLIRPEAPGVPLPESIFNDALYETKEVYKTIAPLKNKSCAIAAYNLSITSKDGLKGNISFGDYQQASAMMQPFSGLWENPNEGLIIYDWKNRKGEVLDESGLDFEIKGFGYRLFLLAPIESGWSLIGRTDKFLGPSTVNVIVSMKDKIEFEMVEPNDIMLYSNTGSITSKQFDLIPLGEGFYQGKFIGKSDEKVFEIRRNDN